MISQSSSEHSIYIVINNKDFEVAEQISIENILYKLNK